VGPADVEQVGRAKALFNLALPGVTQRLEALQGEYLPVPAIARATPVGAPRAIQASLLYLVLSKKLRIKLRVTAERQQADQADWKIVQHSYHFGPSTDTEAVYLRVCENRFVPHHFHRMGYETMFERGHIPADRAQPPLQNHPMWFLEVVEQFIATGKVSIDVRARA
jgi:hypothetical protein